MVFYPAVWTSEISPVNYSFGFSLKSSNLRNNINSYIKVPGLRTPGWADRPGDRLETVYETMVISTGWIMVVLLRYSTGKMMILWGVLIFFWFWVYLIMIVGPEVVLVGLWPWIGTIKSQSGVARIRLRHRFLFRLDILWHFMTFRDIMTLRFDIVMIYTLILPIGNFYPIFTLVPEFMAHSLWLIELSKKCKY